MAEASSRERFPGDETTSLLDNVVLAAELLKRKGFADVLYVISDGQDLASKMKLKEVELVLVRMKVRVFLSNSFMISPRAICYDPAASPSI